jgi:hypothetical protein
MVMNKEFINEGQTTRGIVTQLSRIAVDVLKLSIETISSIAKITSGMQKGILSSLFKLNPINLEINLNNLSDKYVRHINSATLDRIRKVINTFKISIIIETHQSDPFQISAFFTPDGNVVGMTVHFSEQYFENSKFSFSFMSKLFLEIKAILEHEITHSKQDLSGDTRVIDKSVLVDVKVFSPESGFSTASIPIALLYSSVQGLDYFIILDKENESAIINSLREYFLSKEEVEAFSHEAWRRSRLKTKKQIGKSRYIDNLYNVFIEFYKKSADKILSSRFKNTKSILSKITPLSSELHKEIANTELEALYNQELGNINKVFTETISACFKYGVKKFKLENQQQSCDRIINNLNNITNTHLRIAKQHQDKVDVLKQKLPQKHPRPGLLDGPSVQKLTQPEPFKKLKIDMTPDAKISQPQSQAPIKKLKIDMDDKTSSTTSPPVQQPQKKKRTIEWD